MEYYSHHDFVYFVHVDADGKRCCTSYMVGTAKFTPNLELTKIQVEPSTWKHFQRKALCKTMVERDKVDNFAVEPLNEELTERHLPVIVSYPLTDGLQRFIAKAMRQRRREQQTSPKKNNRQGTIKKRSLQKSNLSCEKEGTAASGEESSPQSVPTTEVNEILDNEPRLHDQSRDEWNRQLQINCGQSDNEEKNRVIGAQEYDKQGLEIQSDAIQVSACTHMYLFYHSLRVQKMIGNHRCTVGLQGNDGCLACQRRCDRVTSHTSHMTPTVHC